MNVTPQLPSISELAKKLTEATALWSEKTAKRDQVAMLIKHAHLDLDKTSEQIALLDTRKATLRKQIVQAMEVT